MTTPQSSPAQQPETLAGLGTPALGAPAFPADAVEVGCVIGAWGIKGWLKLKAYSSDPEALLKARQWFIRPPEGPVLRVWPPLLNVQMCKDHGDGLVAQVQEVADRSAAEAMKGARVFISRASFPAAAAGEYYWVDLLGLTVVNRDGEALGAVVDLISTGAHSVLRLRRPDAVDGQAADANERLIPFVAAYVDGVDLAQRLITVDWGLDY